MQIKNHFLFFSKKPFLDLKLTLIILIILVIEKMYILEKLDKKYNSAFNNYNNRYDFILQNLPSYNHTHIYNNTIFWCWLQGKIDKPILNACLNSIKRNIKGNLIITIINKKNINQYVHFPRYILQKFNNHSISNAHFSDLLRLELLIKYGGTWIDATIFMTKYNKDFFRKDLFLFQKISKKYKIFSNWFITSEKNNPILRILLNLLYEYWRINNKITNYFIFHHFLSILYVKYNKEFNKMPIYSRNLGHLMQRYLFRPFNKLLYNKIINKISIHKLTYKFKNNTTKGLFYHHILQEYN